MPILDLGTFGLPVAYEGLDFDAKGQAAYLSCFVLESANFASRVRPARMRCSYRDISN